jgi:hypothetical protein
MKKYLFLMLIGSSWLHAATGNTQDTVRYEAESAKYKSLQLRTDPNASGGEFLRMPDKGSVEWNINVDTTRWYNLNIRYRAFGGENEEYIVRNGYKYAVGFPGSKEWANFTTHTLLQTGSNVIQIQKSWGDIDFDFLQVSPADIKPELTPIKNIFYKDFPRDIVIQVKKNGSKIVNATCDGKETPFSISEYRFYEDAIHLKIPMAFISELATGNHAVKINFEGGFVLTHELKVIKKSKAAGLTIIAPYVEHGKSILFILPTGKTLLIDCGKKWVRDSLIIPFFIRNKIKKIDYFFLTHYHEDHDSDDKGEKIKKLFRVKHFYDYKSFHTGDSLTVEGLKIKILNSFEDGDEENTRSLILKMTYKGFVYVDGGDAYAINQEKILNRFPNDIKAEVFAANHHFHGSADVDYLRKLNPSLVIIQSQQAIYARSTYMIDFLKNVRDYLNMNKLGSVEGLPALEVGTIVIRANDKNNYSYETYSDYSHCVVPFLFKQSK